MSGTRHKPRESGRLSNAMKESAKKTLIPHELMLPPVLEKVIVVCKDFRCLGNVDRTRVWWNDSKREELKDAIGWFKV